MEQNMNDSIFLTFGLTALIIIVSIVVFLLLVGMYILQAIPIYRMAKKMNHPMPWLAWIPIANVYIRYALPSKNWELWKGFMPLKSRDLAFIIYLGCTYGFSIVTGAVYLVPVIGTILVLPLSLVATVAAFVFTFRANCDLYDVFQKSDNNQIIAIVGLFVPLVDLIYCWMLSAKEPLYYYQPSNSSVL